MSMNECDKLNGYNALVSANHHETFIAPVKPREVTNTAQSQIIKNQTSKEAERVVTTGYSSSPQINTKLSETNKKQNSSSSVYSGGNSTSYYSNPTYSPYSGQYGSTTTANNQYKGNNLDYNSRIAKIRQKAKETASQQKKYEQSRGAGLIDFDGKYSFSIENGRVKHNCRGIKKHKVSRVFNKKMAKQAMVATGVIVLEAALGLAMAEAKSSISSISSEIKKSISSKVK